MRLGAIDFDARILAAARDNNLVVFAGAGVSMGPPSNLPSFGKLAADISGGMEVPPKSQLDKFLGKLHHKGVLVHKRASEQIAANGSEPNELHTSIVRLFRTPECVKIVTTNYDLHFETASESTYNTPVEVFRAPALPKGSDFSGIVHVHGGLPKWRDLVLTDGDFGRAYLTEGWARRFLVDLFQRYVVLFIGYSHDDDVINYLARALPSDNKGIRFALTEEVEKWDLLGITPLHFSIGTGANLYAELYDGMHKLSERLRRGAFDWRTRIVEIGRMKPPIEEELVSEIEQALGEAHTARMFAEVVNDPDWLVWLENRGYFETFFTSGALNEIESILAWWLSEKFLPGHAHLVLDLFVARSAVMNPGLWYYVCHKLGSSDDCSLDETVFKRWIVLLLRNVPIDPDPFVLQGLAEKCFKQGCHDLTIRVLLAMLNHRIVIHSHGLGVNESGELGISRVNADVVLKADLWNLQKVWSDCIQPNIVDIRLAGLLLDGAIHRLEEIHADLRDWDCASIDFDPISFGRLTIETIGGSENDRIEVDVLIDAARDSLISIQAHRPELAAIWIEKMVSSAAPLVRRLSISASVSDNSKTSDKILEWLMLNADLGGILEHHEMYQVIGQHFPLASQLMRETIISKVLSIQVTNGSGDIDEERTDRIHYNWLSWILLKDPDSEVAQKALETITTRHSEWRLSERPDFMHWMGKAEWTTPQSPWSVEQLLTREPANQITDLLEFDSADRSEPNREGLAAAIREACKQSPKWGVSLSEELSRVTASGFDLWPAVIGGLSDAELTEDLWTRLLQVVALSELQSLYSYSISRLLLALARRSANGFSDDLQSIASGVAQTLWHFVGTDEEGNGYSDWSSLALNHSAGNIVTFWIESLSIVVSRQIRTKRSIPEEYKTRFGMILKDVTIKGGAGRCLLASQVGFLFGLDQKWTAENIIPLFMETESQKFAQAWSGYLTWGRMYPELVESMILAFEHALKRIRVELPLCKQRFIEHFAALVLFYVEIPTLTLIPALFRDGQPEDWAYFASYLGKFIRQMEPSAKSQQWDAWLSRYWKNRLEGVPANLTDEEAEQMLSWLPCLEKSFPMACQLAIQHPLSGKHNIHMLYELRTSDLILRYPDASAELLIYLCPLAMSYQLADLKEIAGRIVGVTEVTQARLQEALLKVT